MSAKVRDRTLELLRLAASVQAQQPPAPARNAAPGGGAQDTAGSSQFNASASALRQALALVAGNLDQLQTQCNKQSLFSDLDRSIGQQAQFIKKELDELDSHVAELERHAALFGRSPEHRHFAHSAMKIVTHLRGELVQLTKKLQNCLLSRQRNVKAQHQRRSQYESDQAPVLRKRHNIHSFSAISAFEEAEQMASQSGEASAGVAGGQQQQQMAAMEEAQAQEQLRERRQQSQLINSIETTISELGTMYRSLIHHISMQGETAQRIDQNLGDALFHVDEGKGQLLQYLGRTTRQRSFIIKCLGLVALLAMFLIVFGRQS